MWRNLKGEGGVLPALFLLPVWCSNGPPLSPCVLLKWAAPPPAPLPLPPCVVLKWAAPLPAPLPLPPFLDTEGARGGAARTGCGREGAERIE